MSEAPSALQEPEDQEFRVVVAGHLYSLFVQTKEESAVPAIGWTRPTQVFAEEVQRIDPELVFLLGDSTRYGKAKEWSFLEQTFEPFLDRVRWGLGNHEFRNMEAFEAHGGLVNRSVVLRGNKFIMLDCKMVFEEHDLEFLRREMADVDRYDNVFIMMHYLLVKWPLPTQPLDKLDPYLPYTRLSNWNRDVVPIIAGKVDVVFTGDHLESHIQNSVQGTGADQLTYISTSFRFGRGRELRSDGDGPMLFLELRFKNGAFQVIPRAVPLDARDTWYQSFDVGKPGKKKLAPVAPKARRHALGNSGLTLELDSEWQLIAPKGEPFSACLPHSTAGKAIDLDYRQVEGAEHLSEPVIALWKQGLREVDGKVLRLEQRPDIPLLEGLARGKVVVLRGLAKGRVEVCYSVLFEFGGKVHYISLRGPEKNSGRCIKLMLQIIRTLKRAA